MEWYSSPEFTELMPPVDDFSNSLSSISRAFPACIYWRVKKKRGNRAVGITRLPSGEAVQGTLKLGVQSKMPPTKKGEEEIWKRDNRVK